MSFYGISCLLLFNCANNGFCVLAGGCVLVCCVLAGSHNEAGGAEAGGAGGASGASGAVAVV